MMPPLQPRVAAESGTHRTIPFDYSLDFELRGVPERLVRKSVTVSVESPFVAVSIGYGFVPALDRIEFGPARPPGGIVVPLISSIDPREVLEPVLFGFAQALQRIPLDRRPDVRDDAALEAGFRLNPDIAESVLTSLQSKSPVPTALTDRLFEAVSPAAADQLQFRYAIVDEGSGREFQSEPILNTAGLGIANGDRPFRYFAQPIRFAPRTTIRVDVIEVSRARGTVFIALHGYKVLGSEGTPTGRLLRSARRRRG
ncbi:MAG TPA: hypothetical protein VD833_14795 [Vicinamibacterales bacterium]|nr:hypothetical protein [Vicinamibacterales bacterium]